MNRENAQLRSDLDKLMAGFDTLKKKFARQQTKQNEMSEAYDNIIKILAIPDSTVEAQVTPRKEIDQYLNDTLLGVETPKKDDIKKKILEHNILIKSLKSRFEGSNNTEKNTLRKVVTTDIVKKYKLQTKLGSTLGIKSNFKNRSHRRKTELVLKKMIEDFFDRDDVSRATVGKKEYRTCKKITRQKRYLTDTLKALHQKFIAEIAKISFSTFKKYRPFYVLFPKVKDCESCACIKHSNMQFPIDELKSLNVLKTGNLKEVVNKFTCDFESKNCMYNSCSTCSDQKLETENIDDLTKNVSWFTWILKEQEYEKAGKKKKIKKMVKTKQEGTLQNLIDIFNKNIKAFKPHIFNFYYQYKQYKACINNIKENEAVIHINFSENFTFKYHEEIQAMHFIKEQITLHTGVIYLPGKEIVPFCSISPVNQHNPEAIWAHLDPVLRFIKSLPTHNISTVHFFSDGPTTQYRQKKNFFLFSQKTYEYQFSHGTWSFFEAAHGKGAADGIGGVIKRTLDMKIAHGTDIPNAQTAFEVLSASDTTIKLFYVPVENIKCLDASITKNLTPLPGTMKIHQVIIDGKLKLKYRDLSCFCEGLNGNCECHSPIAHDFTSVNSRNDETHQPDIIPNLKDKKQIGAGKILNKKKKSRKSHDICSSPDDSIDSIIEYADSDATCYMTDDSISQVDDEDHDYGPLMELDEKTGYLKHKSLNKRVTVLSSKTLTKQRADVPKPIFAPGKRKCKIEDEKKEVKPAKVIKLTNSIEKENVTTLLQVKHTPENDTYLDLRKTEIINEKNEGKKSVNIEAPTSKNTVKCTNIENGYQEMNTEKLESISTESEDIRKHKINIVQPELSAHIDPKTDDYEDNEDRENVETESATIDKTETEEIDAEENNQKFSGLLLNDNVIVRYFQRKTWKYYVGEVINIENREGELNFKIKYYKTVKVPSNSLKFVVQKKTDIDVVPCSSIVKKVTLNSKNSKEFYLSDDSDKTYLT